METDLLRRPPVRLRRPVVIATLMVLLISSCGDSPLAPTGGLDAPDSIDAALGVDPNTGATIETDKDDYQPGDWVHIVGTGWASAETVHFHLTRDPLTSSDMEWDVTADSVGALTTGFDVVWSDLGVTFTMTSTGAISGSVTTTVFTDNISNIVMSGASPTPFSPNQASSIGIKDTITVALQNGVGTANGISVRIREGELIGGTLVRTLGPINVSANALVDLKWDGKNGSGSYVADGVYTARLTIASPAGEHDTADRKRRIVVDNTNPVPAVDAVADVPVSTAMTITGTASDLPAVVGAGIEKVEVFVRRPDNSLLASGLATNTGTNFSTWSFGYTPSETGTQHVTAKATDNAGNHTTSGSQAFDVNEPPSPDLAVSKSAVDQNAADNADADPDFFFGAQSEFELTVTNNGNAATDGTTITAQDVLAASLTYHSFSGAGWTCGAIGQTVTCTTTSVLAAAGGSSSLSIFVVPNTVASNVENTASVSGGGDETSANSPTETVDILKAVTTTALVDDVDPTEFGDPVTFTATVSILGGMGGGTPVGSVTFKTGVTLADCSDGTAVTGTSPNSANPATLLGGEASLTVNSLPVGSNTVYACYSGNANYRLSQDSEGHEVEPATTTTVVTVTPNSQQYSDQVELKAEVTPFEILTEQLTGTVHFYVEAAAVDCSSPAPAVSVGSGAITDGDDGVATFTYAIAEAAGSYVVTGCFDSSNASFADSDDDAALTVLKEQASVFAVSHPSYLQVDAPGGDSPLVTFSFSVRETNPEQNSDLTLVAPGDVSNATAKVVLIPVGGGGGGTIDPCLPTGLSGTGYDQVRTFQCSINNLSVDAYEVQIVVTGSYYTGSYLGTLTVFDPSLGFATGGGRFELDGDMVNFGFNFALSGRGRTATQKGNIVVIRHLANGDVCRAKSNQLGPAAITGNVATFAGKANYGCVTPEGATYDGAGNLNLVGWVQDNGEPGSSSSLTPDRFWVSVSTTNSMLTMPTPAASNSEELTGGNIRVPQPGGKSK